MDSYKVSMRIGREEPGEKIIEPDMWDFKELSTTIVGTDINGRGDLSKF